MMHPHQEIYVRAQLATLEDNRRKLASGESGRRTIALFRPRLPARTPATARAEVPVAKHSAWPRSAARLLRRLERARTP